FIQNVLHYSALKTGIAYLPMMITVMAAAGVSADPGDQLGADPGRRRAAARRRLRAGCLGGPRATRTATHRPAAPRPDTTARPGGGCGRDVLAGPDQRAQPLRVRPARPDDRHRGRDGLAVHAADPGGAEPGAGPRRRAGLQPAERGPADRRVHRPGRAGHGG